MYAMLVFEMFEIEVLSLPPSIRLENVVLSQPQNQNITSIAHPSLLNWVLHQFDDRSNQGEMGKGVNFNSGWFLLWNWSDRAKYT